MGYHRCMKRVLRLVLVLVFALLAAAALRWLFLPLDELRRSVEKEAGTGAASDAGRDVNIGTAPRGRLDPVRTPRDRADSEQAPQVAEPEALPRGAIPGEHVLTFYSEADRAAFIALARKLGADVLGTIDLGHGLRLKVSDPAQLAELLREGPTPTGRFANIYVRLPPDPGKNPRAPDGTYMGFGDQWLEWLGVGDDNADWGKGVTVAVLDTGVTHHEAFEDADVTRINLRAEDGLLSGAAGWHGTAVASLIAGSSDNVQGMAPAAELLSLRVLDENGVGDSFTLAEGIVKAADHGAQIINLSLATPSDSPIVREAIRYAMERGVLLVAAAGNDGVEGVSYPGRYNGVLTVAAVDASGRHVYFSNRGSQVDIAAPAVALSAAGSGDTVIPFSGTSAAAPLVAAAAAALLADDPEMTVKEVIAALTSNSNDAGAPGWDIETGHGIIDLERLQYRNVAGIFDAALCMPYLQAASDPPTLTLSVQNRGTELLSTLAVAVSVDGERSLFTIEDLELNQTASREYELDVSALESAGSVDVTCTVLVDGVEDTRPSNNAIRTTLSVGSQ